jgi:hypothetical protein
MNDTEAAAERRLAALGLAVPELLLPAPGTDLSAWAVIACDQFIQDRGYWDRVRAAVGDAPSTLNLIYPEVYLEEPDRAERIAAVHRAMERYLADGVFAPPLRAPVYVERDTPFRSGRRGLVIALDLEQYDWKPGGASLVRPTEGTVPERLPARMEVRRNAPLETPHVLVLIDDEDGAFLPALGSRAKDAARPGGGAPRYDARLMFDSGRVRGWALDGPEDGEFLAAGLETLARRSAEKYGPFLYAMGDGNHSLAAAKGVWEEYKAAHRAEPDLMRHPARWALVEIENLYDPALSIEPIHRILFGVSAEEVQRLFSELPGYSCRPLDSGGGSAAAGLAALVQDESCGRLRFGLVSGEDCFLIEADPVPLAVDALQPLLDRFMAEHPAAGCGAAAMDYIHGTEALFRLAGSPTESAPRESGGGQNAGGRADRPVTGILLPPFRKQGLFETIARRGPLPRKSFSMGESAEKRFYLECRKLFE